MLVLNLFTYTEREVIKSRDKRNLIVESGRVTPLWDLNLSGNNMNSLTRSISMKSTSYQIKCLTHHMSLFWISLFSINLQPYIICVMLTSFTFIWSLLSLFGILCFLLLLQSSLFLLPFYFILFLLNVRFNRFNLSF